MDNFLDDGQNNFMESKNIAEELVQCLATVTMFGAYVEATITRAMSEEIPGDYFTTDSQLFLFLSTFRELEPEKQKKLREAHRDLEMNCPSGLPSDVIPIFKYILWRRERAGMAAFYK